MHNYFLGRVILHPKTIPAAPVGGIPSKYQRHKKVFSEEELQRLPRHTIWDHAIELLPRAPASLPGRLLPLTQSEIAEAQKFVAEHLKRGTIHELWSPYAANFCASAISLWVRRSEEHTSELQSRQYLVCRLLLD